MHALYFYWIFPPDDYLRARSGISTFFKCNEFQFLQAHTCAPQNECKRLLVVLQFFLPMIIGNHFLLFAFPIQFFWYFRRRIACAQFKNFLHTFTMPFFPIFFNEELRVKRGKSCVGWRQFKEASDFGFCKHANAGRSLIKSSRQISSGGISNISPISAFETIHSPSDISVLS